MILFKNISYYLSEFWKSCINSNPDTGPANLMTFIIKHQQPLNGLAMTSCLDP